MRPIKLRLLFPAAMAVSAVLGVAPARAADAQAAIRAADAELSALVAKQDAAGIAALYTTDGQLLASGRDFIRGRPATQEYWQAVIHAGVAAIEFTTREVSVDGATAVEVGEYVVKNATETVVDRGKYMVLWHREKGSWRLHRDMANTSLAAPLAKASAPQSGS
jgi:uncharacterized protein (TIGR02246 family)